MNKVSALITGFRPFGGRRLNSSWAGISWIDCDGVLLKELPVVWGEPTRRITQLVEQNRPTTIVSFGEGKEGFFHLETKALNRRDQRPDENGQLPSVEFNSIDGPSERYLGTDVKELEAFLVQERYPTIVSSDAGQYLCEETIFTLEGLRVTYEEVQRVYFCHLPPYGTEIRVANEMVKIDAVVLKGFVAKLIGFLRIGDSERIN
jgi:pyroglutamyl-peptidase